MTPEEYKRKQVMARRLLRSYLGQSASIETIPDQIRTLELNAISIRSATTDQTPVQGGGNKREEALSGSIVVKLYNLGNEPYYIKAGDKIAQLVVRPVLYLSPVQVDKIEGGERGNNGFGSTGR